MTELKEEIEKRLERIESDERIDYEPANVEVNAPLALIQVRLTTERDTLKWVLDQMEDSDNAK